MVGAQAVALLQVGNGEIDVAIVDQQRRELERLRQGMKVEFHTVLQGPQDGARGLLSFPPAKMCANLGRIENPNWRTDERRTFGRVPARHGVQVQRATVGRRALHCAAPSEEGAVSLSRGLGLGLSSFLLLAPERSSLRPF